MAEKLIHFDWAIKKLLRHKANFVILEGFLSELLKFDVEIETILESEGNQEYKDDKFNRVDILIKNRKGELMLVEIQNNSDNDYFHRMLYGVSKLITEYINLGEPYRMVKKIYSINIVYFQLGHGNDYVYEYQGNFVGLHDGSILEPTTTQQEDFGIQKVADIYPKYYILKVNNFDDVAKDSLDEWIYFLKNSEVRDDAQAKGLTEAKAHLRYEHLSKVEKKRYESYQKSRIIAASVEHTAIQKGMRKGLKKGLEEGLKQGLAKGLEQGKKDIAKKLKDKGIPVSEIVEMTGLPAEIIRRL